MRYIKHCTIVDNYEYFCLYVFKKYNTCEIHSFNWFLENINEYAKPKNDPPEIEFNRIIYIGFKNGFKHSCFIFKLKIPRHNNEQHLHEVIY